MISFLWLMILGPRTAEEAVAACSEKGGSCEHWKLTMVSQSLDFELRRQMLFLLLQVTAPSLQVLSTSSCPHAGPFHFALGLFHCLGKWFILVTAVLCLSKVTDSSVSGTFTSPK
jgi:hypothetical protein